MPIKLNDLNASLKNSTQVKYDTRFFDTKRLTGRGGNTQGFLSANHEAYRIKPDVTTIGSDKVTVKKSYSSNGITVNHIPFNPLTVAAEEYIQVKDLPDNAVAIASYADMTLYIDMEVQAGHIEDKKFHDPIAMTDTTVHDYRMNYDVSLYVHIKSLNKTGFERTDDRLYLRRANKKNYFMNMYLTNPVYELKDTINSFRKANWTVNDKAIDDFFSNYDMYESVCRRSKEWQSDIVEILDDLFTQMGKQIKSAGNPHFIIRAAKDEVRYIMTYKVPLKFYKDIHTSITKNFSKDFAEEICKENLNLLLSDTLTNLEQNKSNIIGFTPSTNNNNSSYAYLSNEQKKAVESTEPLILVQAGAGTGKSTTVKYRIKKMVDSGIKSEDITVLSFSNAAVDNITKLNCDVNSITIASMITEIYRANFPGQLISTVDTIINTIDIMYPKTGSPNRGFIDDFQRVLRNLAKGNTNAFTDVNNFVEKHYDDVIQLLTDIKQTCLELEIIVCYQKINSLIEPASIASKYLIIDEVQDNSVFEFVYLIKYIEKHNESLFIVGDCAQTLFEFRDANPDALNILENSGTFECYSLQINYRSNPEILAFANIMLGKIRANQFAQIQLQANSLTPITEQSFLDTVTFNYHRLPNIRDWTDSMGPIFSSEVRSYIDSCFNKGESVTILAFTRNEVATVKNVLEQLYPNKIVTSLVPEKNNNSTIFTKFIRDYWESIKIYPYQDIVRVIRTTLLAQLNSLVYNPSKMDAQVREMLNKWEQSEMPTIQSWINQTNNGQMTEDDFRDNVKNNMIEYEIQINGIHQALLAEENQKRKNIENIADADFVLSTIHSAKGLEFDNVVVLYRNENDLDEEKKRMYYVALTRAKHTEYILAYDTRVSPQIQADYNSILKELHATSPAPNSPLNKGQKKNIHI